MKVTSLWNWYLVHFERGKKKKKNSLISDKLTNAWCKLTHERRVFKGDHVVMYNVFNLLGIGWIEYEVQFFQKRNIMNIVLGLNH